MAFSAVQVKGIYGQVYGIRRLIVVLILLGIAGAVVSFLLPESSSEQVKLVGLLRERFTVRPILISGLPPVHKFPSLPEPLRRYIGARAKRLDAAIQSWARIQPDCDHVPLSLPVGPESMASDSFHPGPGIYALWGKAASEMIRDQWK